MSHATLHNSENQQSDLFKLVMHHIDQCDSHNIHNNIYSIQYQAAIKLDTLIDIISSFTPNA
jgi:preprotein translocase subunit Sec63